MTTTATSPPTIDNDKLMAFVFRAVDEVGANEDVPPMAKVIAGISLFAWTGVIYWGRLIPWGLGG